MQALWNCIFGPASLEDVARYFAKRFDHSLVDVNGQLTCVLRSRAGRSFARTAEPEVQLAVERGGLYALYESRERYERQRHARQWADFAKGHWTSDLPMQAGMYFARSRDGFQTVKTIVRLPTGELHDITSGFVTPGRVTNWVGQWWSVRVPVLLGAKL